MKNDFLKDVIADADVIKKMAIENAKASLNETFDSKLKSMLSAKLQEEADDMDDEDEKNEEFEFEARKSKKSKMDHEKEESEDEESEEESDEEESTDESLDIDAILAEMEDEEDEDEKVDEYKERKNPHVDNAEDSDDTYYEIPQKASHSNKRKDLQEKDEEDEDEVNEYDERETPSTKSAKGEKSWFKEMKKNQADGDNDPENDPDAMEEELDLEALLAEMNDELDEKKKQEDDEEMEDESYNIDEEDMEEAVDPKDLMKKIASVGKDKLKKLKKFYDDELSPKSVGPGGKYEKTGYSTIPSNKSAMEELQETRKQVKTLVKKINETNLINAKLLYFNKILKNLDLSESQKIKVMSAFDKVKTTKEAKLVYEALNETFVVKKTTKPSNLKESFGVRSYASKSAGTSTNKGKIITEGDATVARWQKLAGIIK